jgi:hypothetical protein
VALVKVFDPVPSEAVAVNVGAVAVVAYVEE